MKKLSRNLFKIIVQKKNIVKELKKVLDLKNRNKLLDKYEKLISLLGTSGSSNRLAKDIVLKNKFWK